MRTGARTWRRRGAANDALGSRTSCAYTPDGKLARRIWARGIVTDYTYDSAGNLTRIGYSDATPTITMAYDRGGGRV